MVWHNVGGSVTTQVRFGEKVYSPIIGKGQADIVVSFETMETGKWLEFLKPNGKVVVNDFHIPSAPILTGKVEYPSGVIEALKEVADVTVFQAAKLAEDLVISYHECYYCWRLVKQWIRHN